MVFWKIDREADRIVPEEFFGIEKSPCFHELADAGKGPSDGFAFWKFFKTELASGGILDGNPPMGFDASQNEMDYMHVIDWKNAEQVIADGKAGPMHDLTVIRMDVAIEEGLLFNVPEPKSPHGVDVPPNGEYIVVSGKLDPHVTVCSFARIQEQLAGGEGDTDEFGVSILDCESRLETQVERGLGPLRTQHDDQGYAYPQHGQDAATARLWSLALLAQKDYMISDFIVEEEA